MKITLPTAEFEMLARLQNLEGYDTAADYASRILILRIRELTDIQNMADEIHLKFRCVICGRIPDTLTQRQICLSDRPWVCETCQKAYSKEGVGG